jgi:probable HAF family extracellular repeat protein
LPRRSPDHALGTRQLASPSGIGIQNHPFIWRDGTVEPIPLDDADPKAINNADQVVGQATRAGLPSRYCFLFQNGQVTDLDTLTAGLLPAGTHIIFAPDINDEGHILVECLGPSFEARMLLLVPDEATLRKKVEGLCALAVLILFGVIQDGGGAVWIGKTLRRIPPWGPLSIEQWEMTFDYCSALLGDVVEDESDLEKAHQELRRVIDEGIAGRG